MEGYDATTAEVLLRRGSEWNRECPYCGFPRMEI